ncbi:hypothetical protein BX666DRAFT_2019233 [Dichotomocladium elegans]|nr:hypothetical protein BX666DRAFT_2019233 [Dichotomocladium elegans]
MTIPPQDYLRTLDAIRDRCYQVYDKAKAGGLLYFDIDESKLPAVVDHVEDLTHRRFPDLSTIPPHSRLRHFGKEYNAWLATKQAKTQQDKIELARKLVDLVIVSVLVDAGAGEVWRYQTQDGSRVGRSEGLALASVDMFLAGYFSSSPSSDPDHVDAKGLSNVTVERMTEGFQVTAANPMVGLEGRSALLNRLGAVLETQTSYFPSPNPSSARPGNLIDYLLANKASDGSIHIDTLWKAVMSLGGIWPARIEIEGVQLGDVWPCPCLGDSSSPENLVPFHKLSQWLTYSLIEVIETSLELPVQGVSKMTGLPEYRNGGLFIDHGVFVLKPKEIQRGSVDGGLPTFDSQDPLIVEWRALTVVFLDKVHKALETKLGQPLKLAQVLESGTWTAGREIAAKLRPETAGPPIVIVSDGTVF